MAYFWWSVIGFNWACVGLIVWLTFWRAPRYWKRQRELFDEYARGRMDEHNAMNHGEMPTEILEQVFRGEIPPNVHGEVGVIGPDGQKMPPQGWMASADVSEATMSWVVSGSDDAWRRMEFALAAARAMKGVE